MSCMYLGSNMQNLHVLGISDERPVYAFSDTIVAPWLTIELDWPGLSTWRA